MTDDIVSQLKMRHLSLLVAIADFGTTHRAAHSLNMTQSTASKMLRDVEEIYGATLFEREPRGMTATPLGQIAIADARKQLSRLKRFSDDFRARVAGGYGTLAVGAITGAAPDVIARAVVKIKKHHPQLMLSLHGDTSEKLLDELESGQLDIAVGRFSELRQQQVFAFTPLAQERLLVVVRRGHPLEHRAVESLTELVDCSWVVQPVSNPSRQALDAAFDTVNRPFPTNIIECSSVLLILNLVLFSDAVALLPEAVVEAHRLAQLFSVLPVRPAITLSDFGLVTVRDEVLSEAAQTFCDILLDLAAELQ